MDKSQAAAAETTETTSAAKPKFNFSVAKLVTLAIRKTEVDVPVYVKLIAAIKKGEAIEEDKDGKKKEPVDILTITDLETGEQMQIIAGKILVETIKKEYPDESYIDKCFEFTKLAARGSGANKYHPWKIVEISPL